MGSRRNVDRLSSMPDEVIAHILSLMPTKYAFRTCLLSKSWIHSWKSVPKLDVDDNHPFHDMHCLNNYVDRLLEPREASQVKVFRLHCSEIWVRPTLIKKWIDKATKLNVSEIEVHTFFLDLPRPFICKTLTKLTLVVSPQYQSVWNTTSIDLPLLKTLDIKVFTNPNLNAFKLIPGCPLLEALSLGVGYHHKGNNEVYNFNIPTLKRLKLHFGKGVYIKKVVLNVPNLEELFVAGGLCSPVVMENFPPLVSVTLSCVFTFGLDQPWVELLTGISGAKSLTMESVNENPPKSLLPKYLNLKHLEFRGVYGDPRRWLLINQIIESSDELEHLCIEEKPYVMVERNDSCWIEPQIVPTCMINNLKAIKFLNCKGWKSDLQFLSYMLGNALVLKTLTIMCNCISTEEELRLKAELLKLPRASRYCEIHFIASGSRSTST